MTEAETKILTLIAELQSGTNWLRISPTMTYGINPTQEQQGAFRLAAANLELRDLIERLSPAGGQLTHARLSDHGRRWIDAERQSEVCQ